MIMGGINWDEFVKVFNGERPQPVAFDTSNLPLPTAISEHLLRVKSGDEACEELERGFSPSELFGAYVVDGSEITNGDAFAMVVTSVDLDNLTATAIVTKTHGDRCWFHVGEPVHIGMSPCGACRVTSDLDDHGQAMFFGAEYGGIGIGS